MRDFAANCFGHSAVSVAGSSRSRYMEAGGRQQRPSQNTVSCFYRTTLVSTKKELLVEVSWHRINGDASVGVIVDDGLSSASFRPNGTNSHLLRRKGSRSFIVARSMVVLYWDISAAKYSSGGPEPVKDFYLIAIADGELILLLGDKCRDFIRKFPSKAPVAESSMYSRRELVIGGGAAAVHCTRARFRDGGKDHEVSIMCRGDERDARNAELYVCIDRRKLVQVKSIHWNFRGNQTISVDGSPVDVLWDVHDWWFRESSGGATFVFRARSSSESRLWPDENFAEGIFHFSLSIQAFKSL